MDNEMIVARLEALKSDRSNVEGLWDLLERFIQPLRGDFFSSLTDEGEVDWRRREVYDGTAIVAAQGLASSLHGNLTSPATQWFSLKFRDDDINEDQDATEWLQDCSRRVWEALQDSNFNVEASEAYLDLVAFGTAMITEEVEGELTERPELVFQAIPLRECYFEEDWHKDVITFYRRLQWTPVQIISKFGDDTPQSVKDKAATPNGSTEKLEVVFCVWRRDEVDEVDGLVAPEKRPYGYKYILASSKETLGEEGGYYEMPAFVVRWLKASGSRWGKGPGVDVLGTILTLNQLTEAVLEAAGKIIDPSILADQSAILGDLDLDRGSVNVVVDGSRIRPLESGARFDVSQLVREQLVTDIRRAFYEDQLELKQSPAMTATEVNARYELMQRLMAPVLGRLQRDLLAPLVERTFRIMLRAGLLPQMPDSVAGADLDIEYHGPMARSQKLDIVQAIDAWLGGQLGLAQIKPEAADLVDVDAIGKEKARLMGVPMDLLPAEEELASVRKARAEAQARAQQLAEAQAEGEAMRAVGEGQAALGVVPNAG